MECQAESLVSVVTALVLEQVGLDILKDREEGAAGCVGSNTAAGAGYALRDGSWKNRCQ